MRRGLLRGWAASFLPAQDFATFGLAVATMRADLGLSPGLLAWVFTGYGIAFGCVVIPCAALVDRLGPGRAARIALLLYGAALALAALSPGGGWLVGVRVVQGAAGGLLASAGLALLAERTTPGRARERALADAGRAVALGFVAGSLGGAACLAALGWRAAVALVAATAVLAAAGRAERRPVHGQRRRGRMALTAPAAIASLTLSAALSPRLLCALLPALGVLGLRRRVAPAAAAACLGGAAATATGVAGTLLISEQLQGSRGAGVLETGLTLSAFGVAALPAGVLVRRVVPRWGGAASLAGGLGVQGCGLAGASLGQPAVVVLAMGAFGLGHVVATGSAAIAVMEGARRSAAGAGAALAAAQYLGAALGPLVLRAGGSASARLLAAAAVAGLGAAAVFAISRGSRASPRHA